MNKIVVFLYCAAAAIFWEMPLMGKTFSLEDLVGRALERYERLDAQKYRIKAARAGAKKVYTWYNPEFEAHFGKKFNEADGGREYGFGMVQRFAFPGRKSLMAEIAGSEVKKAVLSEEELRLFVRYEVVRLSFRYYALLKRSEHVKDRLGRLRLINSFMKGRLLISPQKKVEKYIIKSRIKLIEREVNSVTHDKERAFASLNVYTGFDGMDNFRVNLTWLKGPVSYNLDRVAAAAVKKGFLIRTLKERAEASGKRLALAKKSVVPEFGIGLYYNDEHTGAPERTIGAAVQVPLPLWNQNSHAVDMEKARSASRKKEFEGEKRKARSRAREVLSQYKKSANNLKRFPVDRLSRLERQMRYADREFRKGRVGLQTYLDMDEETHNMIEAIFRSQIDYVDAYTALLFLMAETKEIGGGK